MIEPGNVLEPRLLNTGVDHRKGIGDLTPKNSREHVAIWMQPHTSSIFKKQQCIPRIWSAGTAVRFKVSCLQQRTAVKPGRSGAWDGYLASRKWHSTDEIVCVVGQLVWMHTQTTASPCGNVAWCD
jgi:hypothetical protein